MDKKYNKSVFIFRRDLRLFDNTALLEALKLSRIVILCFIFDPRQIETKHNAYFSKNAFQFMIESLQDLDREIKKLGSKLYCFLGTPSKVIKDLVKLEAIEAVFVNRDYTPFSQRRDSDLKIELDKESIAFHSYSDCLLTEVGSVMTGKGTPYTIFSYFAKKARKEKVRNPQRNSFKNFFNAPISLSDSSLLNKLLPKSQYNQDLFAKGGRTEAKKILKKLKKFSNYEEIRNYPAQDGTTGLSAHNKFGTVSIREVYHTIVKTLGHSSSLINELYWRDFFHHVSFHFPFVFGRSFRESFINIEWENDINKFKLWCEGKTGFPIVDAGMSQLNKSGFIHNRVRMIVASFLVKDLHIDWQWGEQYFAQKLVDYDPSVNNGNWQWAASTGCDAQPYFRVFNPWLQGKKYDPNCKYIKKWVPELSNYEPKDIHKLEKGIALGNYPEQIVNHAEAKEVAEDLFIEAKNTVN